jgi:hypothetical protein
MRRETRVQRGTGMQICERYRIGHWPLRLTMATR